MLSIDFKLQASASVTATRKLLDRGDGGHRPGGQHNDDDDEDENDDEDGEDGEEGGGTATITNPSTSTATSCSLTVGGTTTNFTKCYNMGQGTTYFSLNGDTLSAGYKVKSSGWAALAIGQPHSGASAVWYTGSATSTVTMNGFSSSAIVPPSNIKFSNIKAGKASTGDYVVVFTMTWPTGSTSLPVALGTGAGTKTQHASIPKRYSVAKSSL